MPNEYSPRWFEAFHNDIGAARTELETAFIRDCLPLPDFRRILDLCCGSGRHARALATAGYAVVGIERDENALRHARALAGGPAYINQDIRTFALPADSFDAAIVMSQSFGLFDDTTNQEILRRIANALGRNGRIILDVWNPAFFLKNQGERQLNSSIGIVREMKRIEGERLIVHLRYPGGEEEEFHWQLLTTEEMAIFASSLGLRVLSACTNFDRSSLPSETNPRLHFILAKDELVSHPEAV